MVARRFSIRNDFTVKYLFKSGDSLLSLIIRKQLLKFTVDIFANQKD